MPERMPVSTSLCHTALGLSEGKIVTFATAAMATELLTARYFTLLPCAGATNGTLCLLFSRDMTGSEVVGVRSDDGGHSFFDEPKLSLPGRFRTRGGQINSWRGAWKKQPNSKWEDVHFATHNMAFLRDGDGYVWVGGQHGSNHSSVWHKGTGIWTARGESWRWTADAQVDASTSRQQSQWHEARRLLDGFHEGCVEARRTVGLETRDERAACEFDGRLSLVKHEGEYLLYTRLNPASHGSRFVQVTRSSDMVHWGAFESIELAGYARLQGDIYFLAAASNPVDEGSLVGLIPVVHRGVGCIGISLSVDGRRWAPAVPLTRCARDIIDGVTDKLHDGRRTVHHAVNGVVQRGGHVLLFVHENVPGIVEGTSPEHRGPSRIVRYAVPAATFSKWTMCNLRVLRLMARGRRQAFEPCTLGNMNTPPSAVTTSSHSTQAHAKAQAGPAQAAGLRSAGGLGVDGVVSAPRLDGLGSAPRDNAAFAALMAERSSSNATLLRYVYPSWQEVKRMRGDEMPGSSLPDARVSWVPYTGGCRVARDCYCFHVAGDMSSGKNPDGWKRCTHHHTHPNVGMCPEALRKPQQRQCACFTDVQYNITGASVGAELSSTAESRRCLFSDMRPTKLLAAITAARAAGVTHIIEEGRFGGLTAFMYALHGFRVSSIEFLPLDGPSAALRELTAGGDAVRLMDADGAELLPRLIGGMSDLEASRTMIIFDGEKRVQAWETWRRLRHRFALAVFDDTNIGADRDKFECLLREDGMVWWTTKDPTYDRFLKMERPALTFLRPLHQVSRLADGGYQRWHGGVDGLEQYHFTIVRGGMWSADAGTFAPWARDSRALSPEAAAERHGRLHEKCPRQLVERHLRTRRTRRGTLAT